MDSELFAPVRQTGALLQFLCEKLEEAKDQLMCLQEFADHYDLSIDLTKSRSVIRRLEAKIKALKDGEEAHVATLAYKCKDDPEANGRKPKTGERRYTLQFPLENGDELQVHMGKESMNHFESFIAQMMVDDVEEGDTL